MSVSAYLSQLSDSRLGDLVDAETVRRTGIGGKKGELDIAGTRVFVKRVPITDIELSNPHSTANLFDLPTFYQYGLGSTGFGAWRELATHLMTTKWVRSGEYRGFPVMYHWRVLPDTPPVGFADDFGGIDGTVAHWEGSPAVRRRLEAIGRSTSSLVICLEYVPCTLGRWLRDHPNVGWVEQQLKQGTEFMSARGLVHFDTHFNNILTDGKQLFFADFGLASSTAFDLSPAESGFLADHRGYDQCHAMSNLLRHLQNRIGAEGKHEDFLRAWLTGQRPGDVPAEIAGIIDRNAEAASVLYEFHIQLMRESKQTPFPVSRLAGTMG
ncbi:hypothetical protein JOF56_000191 [Kibdelosporangium banguiense]|uniref:Protein kinase domain-containing protein n=1 Tax=Kibdelosporangium banguiense TaxID=1365924 RepID=A0ABS4T6D9_9PSEU|nr:hypothetical protein [Kibdelosporangium banguiense]MBP2319806.1 hypothetical protein [Kibdelosporangium banguiense]